MFEPGQVDPSAQVGATGSTGVLDKPGASSFLADWRDRGLWRNKAIPILLGAPLRWIPGRAGEPAIRIGWGRKISGLRAARQAKRANQACWLLEDGFLRSLGLASGGDPALSLVVDDMGIYYDASHPSRLEQLIRQAEASGKCLEEAEQALKLIVKHGLSKYNHAPALRLPATSRQRVLVVDQIEGDASVHFGGANRECFTRMLAAAQEENPAAEILVKLHPEAVRGLRRGYLSFPRMPGGVSLLSQDISPLSLLAQVDRVYVVSSQMGFEALMLDKDVICFGLPWYAGWGLTDDRHPDRGGVQVRRGGNPSVIHLFQAAYLAYARYLNPATGRPGSLFDVIHHLIAEKRRNEKMQGKLICIGMSPWKRKSVRPFLTTPDNEVEFVNSVDRLAHRDLPSDTRLVIWGTRGRIEAERLAQQKHLPVWHMEDGFLRSVGLGSDLYRPLSLVVDRSGIYFDPHRPSELEQMLAESNPSDDALRRARELRGQLVQQRLSKYNIGKRFQRPDVRPGRTVILVPGQVEDDASIVHGTSFLRTNLELLREVRTRNPQAYIIYKPHPDVSFGNRRGAVSPHVLRALCDAIATDADIIDCIRAADEVHTLTSLSGFEALLHGRIVHCYGMPFYAGWGLTVDHVPPPGSRGRRLTVDVLVYCALIAYPHYVHPLSRHVMPPEEAVRLLGEQRSNRAGKYVSSRGLLDAWHKLARIRSSNRGSLLPLFARSQGKEDRAAEIPGER